jgi:hypothetical protein
LCAGSGFYFNVFVRYLFSLFLLFLNFEFFTVHGNAHAAVLGARRSV